MQQVRAYKDGDHRWVIVIEGTDASLDSFVGNLVTGLASGTVKPVEHLDAPSEMAPPVVDYAAMEEIKVARPTPPKFVRELQDRESRKVPEAEAEKEPEEPSEAPTEPEKDPESDAQYLLSKKGERRLKELALRMFHTADIEKVVKVKTEKDLKILADTFKKQN